MILTKKQAEGLLIAIDRYDSGKKFTVISGYAGSGKSTLVRFIIEALDVEEKDVCYCAFTGKAAEVLGPKGFKAGKNELFPIPANQRQLNSALPQNPGY